MRNATKSRAQYWSPLPADQVLTAVVFIGSALERGHHDTGALAQPLPLISWRFVHGPIIQTVEELGKEADPPL